ncbi:TetR/AcrR family transcriptional regulator [Phytomonospora endophytica]|uniref:AcrR family transcriptional regulator n=1 Tax=Phytomonospora endophytica TaxID=714109 RepID=A0A841FGQ1_9ACTN|nr:TetR family transcriptional regulator [Phytomonospora endophytica]MBB6035044.1 AcrR family transcriptional regulator [Phytomonospora endophytica]GIG68298.1 TetR family transcriptional regulator [Phytomonospora endophytica]
MPEPEGLRERKKRETRQRISDHATALFAIRGFDQVSVSEVAEAAGVSRMTVINYFPLKEDLVFDRTPDLDERLATAVRERPAGNSFADAVRDLMLDLIRRRHPLGGFGANFHHFWAMVWDSPPLRRRDLELAAETETAFAGVLAEETGTGPEDPRPRLAAAVLMATYRALVRQGVRTTATGAPLEKLLPGHLRVVEEAFGDLAGGLADYGRASRD